MRTWLDWLLGFFILGIADADGGADANADADAGADAGGDDDAGAGEAADDNANADAAGADDADLDLDAGADDAGADDGAAATEREKAKAIADENERLKAELGARRPSATAMPTEESRLLEQEEARLRDQKTTDLERWQINSNRTLRENKRASSMALFQAQDISDKTAFNQLAVTKPAIHKRYAERVEAEITRMRANGQNAPREAVLRYLIGNDAMEGKLTSKKAAAKAADTNTIERGRSPGARSDVASRGRMTESQKREKRLEGVQL